MKSKVRTSRQRTQAPRLYHTKSRNGCHRCKARRVKCDEARPICSGCKRHSVSCVYDILAEPVRQAMNLKLGTNPLFAFQDQISHNGYESSASSGSMSERTDSRHHYEPRIRETKSRRLLELQLFQEYITKLSQPFPVVSSAAVKTVWLDQVPKLAFRHDNLLYEVFALSALHMLRAEPKNPQLLSARQTYRTLALREQRNAVAQLSNQNADAVCFTSLLLLVDTFATLQDRVLEPYSPPTEWLYLGKGAASVFTAALSTIENYDTATIMAVVRAPKETDDDDFLAFSSENWTMFAGLMSEHESDPWDSELREVYEKTLSFIGSVQLAISNSVRTVGIYRRLIAFALFVPQKFIKLVEEQRPCALVILAHYFALAAQLQPIWWLGSTPQREISAILNVLPPEWKRHMRWVLTTAKLAT